MGLHRLTSVTIGVNNLAETEKYYEDFGLTPEGEGWFSTTDGGKQLRLVQAPTRRLLALSIGADNPDDVAAVESRLRRLDLATDGSENGVSAIEPITGVQVDVTVTARVVQPVVEATPYNGPGRIDRGTGRAPGLQKDGPVKPHKLGHVVMGSTDQAATQKFFSEGIGLKISDEVPGLAAFMRCSTDHHNVLVSDAPVNFIHHTSWQVDDIDEIGRGAMRMLEDHPERHIWGLGRHHIGSNFFWYLKDPAGNFSEYYSDMDCIVEDALWKPQVWGEAHGLFNWGPPPPPSFVQPEDLAALMTGAHSPR